MHGRAAPRERFDEEQVGASGRAREADARSKPCEAILEFAPHAFLGVDREAGVLRRGGSSMWPENTISWSGGKQSS